MIGNTSRSTARVAGAAMSFAGAIGPEIRGHMIREAAYYRYVQRGYAHGADVDDWLAAASETLPPCQSGASPPTMRSSSNLPQRGNRS